MQYNQQLANMVRETAITLLCREAKFDAETVLSFEKNKPTLFKTLCAKSTQIVLLAREAKFSPNILLNLAKNEPALFETLCAKSTDIALLAREAKFSPEVFLDLAKNERTLFETLCAKSTDIVVLVKEATFAPEVLLNLAKDEPTLFETLCEKTKDILVSEAKFTPETLMDDVKKDKLSLLAENLRDKKVDFDHTQLSTLKPKTLYELSQKISNITPPEDGTKIPLLDLLKQLPNERMGKKMRQELITHTNAPKGSGGTSCFFEPKSIRGDINSNTLRKNIQ